MNFYTSFRYREKTVFVFICVCVGGDEISIHFITWRMSCAEHQSAGTLVYHITANSKSIWYGFASL